MWLLYGRFALSRAREWKLMYAREMFESKPMLLQKSQWQYLLCILVFFIYCKRGATNLCHFLCWKKCMYFSSERNHISCNKMLAWWTNCVITDARSLTTLARTWRPVYHGCFGREGFQRWNSWLLITDRKFCSNNGFIPICLYLRRLPKKLRVYILCTMFALESTSRKRWEPWTVVLKLNQPRWQAT